MIDLFLAAAVTVSGHVQLWSRACDASGRCGLPTALTEKLLVAGSIAEPSSPFVLGMYERTFMEAGLTADLDVMWATGDGTAARPKFLGGAVKLRKTDGALLAECSWYDDAPQRAYFPVGACAGYEGTTQYGVTLYRDPSDTD